VVKVLGLEQLLGALRLHARDTVALPPDLTFHLIIALGSLPAEANAELRQFLADCPLIVLSSVVHGTTATLGSPCSSNAVAELLTVVSLALESAETLLSGGRASTLPVSWLGVALWSRPNSGRYTVELSCLDAETAESLLHMFTLDAARALLRGDPDRKFAEEAALTVWRRHPDALRCLADGERSPTAEILRRCVPAALRRLQPLACLRLFADAHDVEELTCGLVMSRMLTWYGRCAELFDAGQFAVDATVTVLQQASEAICRRAAKMSKSQLQAVDKAALDGVDSHIRIVFQQLNNR